MKQRAHFTPPPESKPAASAFAHPVFSQQIRLRPEEKVGFFHFRRALLIDLKPDGALQTEVFTRLLRIMWTLRRLDQREDDVYASTGLPLAVAEPKEFEASLRYRRFLSKEQRDLTAELRRLQTEAATRTLGPDYAALENFSPLVAVRPLVDLENARCAAKNEGHPRIRFGGPRLVTDLVVDSPPLEGQP